MQIDFHHTATYALARLASFSHSQAVIIAYASQYVDDSVNRGTVRFDNGETYERIASAHKMLDSQNIQNNEDFQVWLPFHFLPGNNGAPAGAATDAPLAQRLLCTPDSPLANEMWQECQRRKNEANAFHRLGITSHVYCDTFSHQMFAGLKHAVNHVGNLSELSHLLAALMSKLEGAVANLLEIGHGGALTCPDLPFLSWKYMDWCGEHQERDNPGLFLTACQRLFQQYLYYLGLDPETKLAAKDLAAIDKLIHENANDDENERHQAWLAAIKAGAFSFGPLTDAEFSQLQYAPFGQASWRYAALGIAEKHDPAGRSIPYRRSFESSDWKHFHDALKEHQEYVLEELLPAYGLPSSFEQAQAMGI